MDSCFNKHIPKDSEKKVIIRPIGKTFVTGLAESFDETYPNTLKNRLTPDEWSKAMSRINEALFFHWPCFMCIAFGYCFSCCTLGLSLCFPGLRVLEAKKKAREEIEMINKEMAQKGVKWSLVEKCSTSWIEVELEDLITFDTDNSQL